MKIFLLFLVTCMIFSLYFVPFANSFASERFDPAAIGLAYFGWYLMVLILTLTWGDLVRKHGCWFFQK